jgi:hypothetical protein
MEQTTLKPQYYYKKIANTLWLSLMALKIKEISVWWKATSGKSWNLTPEK